MGKKVHTFAPLSICNFSARLDKVFLGYGKL